jgi:hypothetical protein
VAWYSINLSEKLPDMEERRGSILGVFAGSGKVIILSLTLFHTV